MTVVEEEDESEESERDGDAIFVPESEEESEEESEASEECEGGVCMLEPPTKKTQLGHTLKNPSPAKTVYETEISELYDSDDLDQELQEELAELSQT